MRREATIALATVMGVAASLLVGLLTADAASTPERSWGLALALSAPGGGLAQVACSSAQSCVSVDGFGAELWDGKRWRRDDAPGGLDEVTCRGRWCMAVGGSPASFIAAVWNGSRWRGVPIETPFNLYGAEISVSCGSARACFGVGWTTVHTIVNCPPDPAIPACITDVPVVERWAGKRWTLERVAEPAVATESLPRPSEGPSISLDAVSCPSARMCMAVGHYSWTSGPHDLFAERWNGHTWTLLKLPAASDQYEHFGGISCPRADACVATGTYGPLRAPGMFIERWDGVRWRVTRLASPTDVRSSALNAISCPSARWCVAVGDELTAHGRQRLLAEMNTGAGWRRVTAPAPKGLYPEFTDVSCVLHPVTCFAIANTQRGDYVQSFIEQYN